jgi:1-acyl-sn-glycerol-3-phosphate acyltransferase
LLYRLLKIPARIALPFYCRNVHISQKKYLNAKGPLLLACNHPNSFLDAVILATLFQHPVYSLARGDAFNKKWAAYLLKQFNILPVYRKREGAEHLHKNYETFDACREIFKQNGIVLIFSEALCENEWHLRTIKKGTARIAVSAWEENIPLQILPVAINYNCFHSFGKNIHLLFGEPVIQPEAVPEKAKLLNSVTCQLEDQLRHMVYEIDKADKNKQADIFSTTVSRSKKIALGIPAAAGFVLHYPLFFPVEKLVASKAFHSVHYDSIMVGMLFVLYPFYILMLGLLSYLLLGGYWWAMVLLAVPFCGWSYLQLKKQLR